MPAQTALFVPFFKSVAIPLGAWFVLLGYLMIVGMSNAVNLTDGLDGLAILPAVMVGAALGLIAYVTGNVEFSDYLQIPYIAGAGELAVFCGALIGAGLGFLWFNTYPAQIFMGDVGALALGAALGLLAIIVRHEIVLLIMGGLFVLETASVIIQVISFRLTGRRVFRMAPIHHHFELKGWPEPRVIVRFLDHHSGLGDHWFVDTEVAMSNLPRTVILGFGLTGQSVARHLCAKNTRPVVLDSRPVQPVADDWPMLDIRMGSRRMADSLTFSDRSSNCEPGATVTSPFGAAG